MCWLLQISRVGPKTRGLVGKPGVSSENPVFSSLAPGNPGFIFNPYKFLGFWFAGYILYIYIDVYKTICVLIYEDVFTYCTIYIWLCLYIVQTITYTIFIYICQLATTMLSYLTPTLFRGKYVPVLWSDDGSVQNCRVLSLGGIAKCI